MGKSSLMRMIEEELQADGIQAVWFNAWMHQHLVNPAEGLVKTILLALRSGARHRPGSGLYLYILFGRRLTVTVLRLFVHAVAGWARVSDSVVDDIWRNFQQDIALANAFRDKLEKAVARFTRKGGILVVFIDDLDRCGPDAIVKLFEAIKVYLDVRGLVFVLGYDRSALVDSVRSRLISQQAQMAINYLEKVVQIPYPMFAPTDDQIRVCFDKYLEKSTMERVLPEAIRPMIIHSNEGNPRRMKRFVNSFALAQSLGFFPGNIDVAVPMWLLSLHFRRLYTTFLGDRSQIQRFMPYAEVRLALDSTGVDSLSDELRGKLSLFVSFDGQSEEEVLRRLDAVVPAAFVEHYRDSRSRSVASALANAVDRLSSDERDKLAQDLSAQKELLDREPQLFEFYESKASRPWLGDDVESSNEVWAVGNTGTTFDTSAILSTGRLARLILLDPDSPELALLSIAEDRSEEDLRALILLTTRRAQGYDVEVRWSDIRSGELIIGNPNLGDGWAQVEGILLYFRR